MPTVSPIAKYIRSNKVISVCPVDKPDTVRFINNEGKLIAQLKKYHDINYTRIDIDLFKPNENKPFMTMMTVIAKKVRYFLEQHKFMPVNISTKKVISDYEHNTLNKVERGKGLKDFLYIDKIKDNSDVIKERQDVGLPEDFPMYKINKPFEYETKNSFYYPTKKLITLS